MSSAKDKSSTLSRYKNQIVIGSILLVLVIIIAIAIFLLTQPPRTAANLCKVAGEEKGILTGNYNNSVTLDAYKKLEAVAPDSIAPDVTTIRKGYESIIASPSTAMSTGFGIAGSESRLNTFLQSNCSSFRTN